MGMTIAADGGVTDKTGRRIKVGDDLMWTQRGVYGSGRVEEAQGWSGGMKVAGRSLKTLWEDVEDLRIVSP